MLKIFSVAVLALCFFFSCSSQKDVQSFGEKINSKGAISVLEVSKLMEGKDSLEAKFTGQVVECCQNKGCWMTMDIGEGTEMRISFKNYGFFVPKNTGGKTAVIEGWAHRTITSVEELQHYASDEGLSQEEIDKITEPKKEITFIAKGVLINENKPENKN